MCLHLVYPLTDGRRDQFEERGRPASAAKSSSRQSRYKEDVSSLPEEAKSVGSGPINGGLGREVDKGALGLPHDKLVLVKEKKEEIEKVSGAYCRGPREYGEVMLLSDVNDCKQMSSCPPLTVVAFADVTFSCCL